MSAEYKALQTRLNEANAEANRLDKELGRLKKLRSDALQVVNRLKNEIKNYSKREIIVSEHAILRYLERGVGYDMEGVRQAILTPQLRQCIETLGNGKFPLGYGNLRAIVKDRVIVSVLGPEEK